MKRISLAWLLLICLPLFSDAQSRKKIEDIKDLVLRWSADNSSQDMQHLASMYAPVVLFYGKQKDVNTCIKEKEAFFQENPDYTINIGDVEVDSYKSGAIKANFSKIETYGGKDHHGQGYLIFEKKDGGYLITQESDQRMDAKLATSPQMGEKKYQSNWLPVLFPVVVLVLAGSIVYYTRKGKNKKQKGEPKVYNTTIINNNITQSAALSSEEKGLLFEKCIVNLLDNSSGKYGVKHWRSDKKADNGMAAETNRYPDIELSYSDDYAEHRFAIECKWRQGFSSNKHNKTGIEWAKDYQIRNYLDYAKQNNIPVWVAIGVGGKPDKPGRLFLIELEKAANYPFVFETYLQQYERKPDKQFYFDIRNGKLV